MMKVNYDEISKVYDQVREEEIDVINCFLEEVDVLDTTAILDIGCGTGNYTNTVQKIMGGKVYGMDQSEGMLSKAKEKNINITFKLGQATDIPFDDGFFSFIYMTDVIHHVGNIGRMFSEINRILKPNSKVCIVTQSHKQIDLRFISEFFPATAVVDKKRYPDIDDIVSAAQGNGLFHIKSEIVGEGKEVTLDSHYIELLEKKGYSMLHLISDDDYAAGLGRVRGEMEKGSLIRKSSGETLVWFAKGIKRV